ncbi:MAG: tRNA dihydrouridine synthase DusB [Oscillospiraceae bacterium]|nr:tRNA dihydrouridine synthase DusB [Oscillospiraceae bacterium]
MNIGNVEINGKLFLAPMAGVTDIAFRKICRDKGAAFVVTEMISAKALSFNDKKTFDLMRLLPDEHPAAVQIFGHEPEIMAEAAQRVHEETGCEIVDINMGCPVGKIATNGDGSGLMKTPELARDIIEKCVKAAPCPVTVKFRKGWDKGSVNAVEFGQMCEEAGASAICVHDRTRSQMYEGKADWDIIRDVKKAVKIPVIANGDIWEAADCEHILRYTGCDGAMIGRGVFGNPWIFEQGNAAIEGKEIPPLPPLAERVDTAVRQITLSAELKGECLACLEARRHMAWYLRGVAHSGYFKSEIVKVETLADVLRIAEGIKRELR